MKLAIFRIQIDFTEDFGKEDCSIYFNCDSGSQVNVSIFAL